MNQQTYTDGVLRERVVDNLDGTGTRFTYDAQGVEIAAEPITLPVFAYPPLDTTGALATLLAVEGVLTLADAANAVHQDPAHLVAEAQAWAVG